MPTNEEINRVLAEKLMGMKPIEGFYYYGDDTWNPLRNIEQAMMCATKTFKKGWRLYADCDGTFQCVYFIPDGEWFRMSHRKEWFRTPAEAIARACYEATKEGW